MSGIFKKKVTQESFIELVEAVGDDFNKIYQKIDRTVDHFDKYGHISGEITEFLLQKSGFAFAAVKKPMTEKQIKSLGVHKTFSTPDGDTYIIAKESVIKKLEACPKTKSKK